MVITMCQPSIATKTAVVDGGMMRVKSSSSLAAMNDKRRRGRSQSKRRGRSHSKQKERGCSNRRRIRSLSASQQWEHALQSSQQQGWQDAPPRAEVTAARSQSFTDSNSSNINNRNRRDNFLRRSGSDLTSGSIMTCSLHPQVRMRRNRCPRCAAWEMKKMRRKSLGKGVEVATKSDDEQEVQYAEDESHAILLREMNNAADMSSIDSEDTEIEEVPLDDRWVQALREISERLALERSHQQLLEAFQDGGDQEERADDGDDGDQSSSTSLDTSTKGHPIVGGTYDEFVEFLSQGGRESLPTPMESNEDLNTTLSNLSELQQTIERATKAIGNGSVDEDDLSISQSSIAGGRPVAKMFAESKGQPLPRASPQTSLQVNYQELEPAGRTKFEVTEVITSDISCQSSGSDESELSSESYNSLAAPPAKSSFTPVQSDDDLNRNIQYLDVSNKTQDSPTSVMNTDLLGPSEYEQVIVEDVTEESDDDEEATPTTFLSKTVVSSPGKTASASPSKSSSRSRPRRSKSRSRQLVTDEGDDEESPSKTTVTSSFFSALVNNSRSRSHSRSRRSNSRSNSRGRNVAGGASNVPLPRENEEKKGQEVENQSVPQPEVIMTPEESPQSNTTPVSETSPPEACQLPAEDFRGPITHPQYKLGDVAHNEDMVIFPKHNSQRRSRRRRRRRNDISNGDDSSSSSDSDEDEEQDLPGKNNITRAIGQLRHLDAAFVLRSNGQWTYALVADGDDSQIRFVVNDRGSTKSYPKALWKSCIRRIRVLTPRQGDRFATNVGKFGKSSRKRRSIGGGGSSRRGNGNSRLVSPSPTRRNSGTLNLPPPIMEERVYNNSPRVEVIWQRAANNLAWNHTDSPCSLETHTTKSL